MSVSFGDLVRRGREMAGLSQSRLAHLIGKSATTIRSWEHGRTNPGDARSVAALAAVLGLDESDLLGRAGFDAPAPKSPRSAREELSSLATERTELVALAPPVDVDRGFHSHKVMDDDVAVRRESVTTTVQPRQVDGREQNGPKVTAVAPAPPHPLPHTVLVGGRSYLEDEEEREFYRRRSIITAAVLVFLLITAWWALGRTGSAIGEFIDGIVGSLDI
ncbi:MAG: helix-turn-helix domain-containing protein [Acidimicrobiia bacterium]